MPNSEIQPGGDASALRPSGAGSGAESSAGARMRLEALHGMASTGGSFQSEVSSPPHGGDTHSSAEVRGMLSGFSLGGAGESLGSAGLAAATDRSAAPLGGAEGASGIGQPGGAGAGGAEGGIGIGQPGGAGAGGAEGGIGIGQAGRAGGGAEGDIGISQAGGAGAGGAEGDIGIGQPGGAGAGGAEGGIGIGQVGRAGGGAEGGIGIGQVGRAGGGAEGDIGVDRAGGLSGAGSENSAEQAAGGPPTRLETEGTSLGRAVPPSSSEEYSRFGGGNVLANPVIELPASMGGGEIPAIGWHTSENGAGDKPALVGGEGVRAAIVRDIEPLAAEQTMGTGILPADGRRSVVDACDLEEKPLVNNRAERSLASSPMLAHSGQVVETLQTMFDTPQWNEFDTSRRAESEMFREHLKLYPLSSSVTENNPQNQSYRDSLQALEMAGDRLKDLEKETPEARRKLAGESMNQIADELGYPHVQVKRMTDRDDARGAYRDGTIYLPDESMMYLSKNELARTLTHEMMHLEQDVVQIRRLADKLGVGATATEEQRIEISKHMRGMIDPDSPFLADVLRKRDGKHLSSEESERADALLLESKTKAPEFHSNQENVWATQQLPKLISSLRTNPDEAIAILRDCDSPTPDSSSVQYLQRQPEIQTLLAQCPRDKQGQLLAPNASSEDAFSENLQTALEQLLQREQAEAPRHCANYREWLWEQEAWATGEKFGDLMSEQ